MMRFHVETTAQISVTSASLFGNWPFKEKNDNIVIEFDFRKLVSLPRSGDNGKR